MNETNISTVKDNYGGLWVKDLLKYVINLTKEGMTQQQLLRMLLIGKGLKPQKAKEFLSDFAELGFITFKDNKFWSIPIEKTETTEATSKNEFEQGMHPCWNCGKVIPNNMSFCSKFCAKEYSSKKKKVK